MPKLNTTVKAVRIDNEKLAALEKMLCGRSINSWMNEKIDESLGGKPEISRGTPLYGLDEEILKDLDTMARFGGGSVGEIVRMLDEGLNNGSLILGANRIEGKPPINLDRFLERCREVGADPQKVLDKATGGIR